MNAVRCQDEIHLRNGEGMQIVDDHTAFPHHFSGSLIPLLRFSSDKKLRPAMNRRKSDGIRSFPKIQWLEPASLV